MKRWSANDIIDAQSLNDIETRISNIATPLIFTFNANTTSTLNLTWRQAFNSLQDGVPIVINFLENSGNDDNDNYYDIFYNQYWITDINDNGPDYVQYGSYRYIIGSQDETLFGSNSPDDLLSLISRQPNT